MTKIVFYANKNSLILEYFVFEDLPKALLVKSLTLMLAVNPIDCQRYFAH